VRGLSSRGRAELVCIDAVSAHWRVHSASKSVKTTLGRAVQDALATIGVAFGRRPAVVETGTAEPRAEATPSSDEPRANT
jgi:hypothetical protein